MLVITDQEQFLPVPFLGPLKANRFPHDSKFIMYSEKTGVTITSCRKGKFQLETRKTLFRGSGKAPEQVTQ